MLRATVSGSTSIRWPGVALARGVQVQIEETRGEILRLVAKLRASRATAGSAAGRVEDQAPADRAKPARRRARRARPAAPAEAPDASSARVRQRQQELAEIRELRQRLERRNEQSRGFVAALERVERRICGLEEAIESLRRSSAPPPRRRSSGPPRRRTSKPPARGDSKRPAALAPVGTPNPSEWTFGGRIQEQMLSDMLQLVSSNGLTGMFVVEADGARTELYFDEGAVFHAAGGGLLGEQAFFAAFSAEYGLYYFQEVEELPAERTIDSSTQLLILEALRQIDESSK